MEEELSSLHRSVVVDRAKELSYFKVDTPSHLVDGITTGEYNVLKGAIAGPVLLVTAPFACAIEEACKGKVAVPTYINTLSLSSIVFNVCRIFWNKPKAWLLVSDTALSEV